MLVIPALFIWALFQCCHLGNCGAIPCPGPTISFMGLCYRFVDERTNFWGARRSCFNCGGQLANVSENSVLTSLSDHLNRTSWWVGQLVEDHLLLRDAMVKRLCPALTDFGVLQQAPCLQKYGFICQTDGHDCNSERTQRSAALEENHDQRRHSARRTKRSISQNDIPDIPKMAFQLVNKPIMEGQNLTNLLTILNYLMEDREDNDTLQLNYTLSLLGQLSVILQAPDIISSPLFSNLSKVVYFGVNDVLRAALSSCSQFTWTTIEKQSFADSAIGILNILQLATLVNVTGEVTLQTPLFSMLLKSMNFSEIGNMVLSFPGQLAQVVFPSLSSIESLIPQASVQVQMISFAQNPYVSDTSINITGTVVSLSLFSQVQEVSVHDLTDNFQIFLPQHPSNTTTEMQTPTDKALQLSLMAPAAGSTLVIIVSVNHRVQLDLYHGVTLVPKAQVTETSDTGFYEVILVCASKLHESAQISSHTKKMADWKNNSYTWLVTPEMFSDLTARQTFLVAPNNGTPVDDFQFGVSTLSANCVYWNTKLQKWQSDGCMVGPKTTVGKVQCLCNHLTFFGSSFLVMPVQIDVTRTAEYFSHISENPVIVILLACFYACYIFAVLWARRMDKRDLMQNRFIIPRDSDNCGLYRYLISVSTGHRHGAGTSSKVCLSMGGLHGQFGPILLSDGKSEIFKSGNRDVFLLSVPYPLGELKSITLSHDGSGPRKRWYITQVTVQDIQMRKSWYFLCNAWLVQPAKGDTSSKTFTVADDQELRSFRNIFLKKTLRGLRDEHIWISVINHPARSVFTRVQRVSCCMCLLLCTIVINLMFWEMPQASYPVIISFGSINLTWKDIMIAVESAILMFPVNLLIVYIFRNTQPKEKRSGDKKSKKTANAKKGPTNQNSQAAILEDLSLLVRTLSQNSWNNIKVDLNKEQTSDYSVLLQTLSQLLQKQIPSGTLTVSVPLAQLPSEDLHTLFCGHYVLGKLKKVSANFKPLGNQTIDKQEFEEINSQLQALMNGLDKCVPPVPVQRSSQKKVLKKKRLPWWFLYIGWFILISISIVSTYFTMMYGFQYGKQSSIRWIISMALSLFQSIFILQPLKVVGFAVFFALVLRKVEEEEEDILDGELNLPEDYQTSDETSL